MKYRRYFYSYCPTPKVLNYKNKKAPKIGASVISIELLLLLTVSVLNVDSVLHLLTLCD